jgi:hypothetical protein
LPTLQLSTDTKVNRHRKRRVMRSTSILAGLAPLLLGAVLPAFFLVSILVLASGPAEAGCELRSRGGAIKHVVHIQLDNVHLRRDNPNVPSDLEQMPHLLDFLISDGIVGGNHQTSPLAQKATDALTILTGLHGDRMGVPVTDSYGYFRSDGSIGFASARAYWTVTGGDGKPLMLADTGKTAPAPWVPFTRAGCDVGALATSGLTLQELAPDVATVLGTASREAQAAASDPAKARADLLGIAIHCARSSSLCGNADARPDLLPDEPGGYLGFNALFGNRHVQPVISPGGPVKDIAGHVIADADGHPGFPNPSEPTAAQSFGYAATMLEAGVPVVYVSVGDVHRQIATAAGQPAVGPGAQAYVSSLSAYDAAFKAFTDRLAADGITKRNTLFMVVPVENDVFVGGPPSPPDCNGVAVPCTYPQIGEIDTSINRLLATERRDVTAFDIVFGNAPSFYVNGNPLPTDPLARMLQQDVGKLTALNPITDKTDKLAGLLADRAEMQLLHMVSASPARSPNFIMFGDPNYFHATAPNLTDCSLPPACVENNPGFAWAHDDMQQIAGSSWFGMTGPGVAHLAQNADIFSHDADLRPTMLALLGLTDSFVHDGVVLVQALDDSALPPEVLSGRDAFIAVALAYKKLNDPLGQLGRNSLVLATQAIKGSDTSYQHYLDAIGTITARRDALARKLKGLLDGAAFAHQPIDPTYGRALIGSADALINEVEDLAGSSIGLADQPWKAADDGH